MGGEFAKVEGRLALAQQKAEKLTLGIKAGIRAIRDALDPLAEDPADLPAEEAAVQAVDVAAKVAELKAVRDRIAAFKRALGR